MSIYYTGPEYITLTPEQQAQSQAKLAAELKDLESTAATDDLLDFAQSDFGPSLISMSSTLAGAMAMSGGMMVSELSSGAAQYNEPLNLKLKSEFDPNRDPLSYQMDNNAEGIAAQLKLVPFEYWSGLLTAPNYQNFKDRLLRIRTSLPEGQKYGNRAGWWYGFATDMIGMGTLGIAAEPLALMGLGARTVMAESAAEVALGTGRGISIAEAAAQGAATVGRGNLFFRYAALGAAEETVYQIGKYKFDPVYDPTIGELAFSYALSGGISGVLGGAVMGRSFVRRNIEEAAQEIRRARPAVLSNGYQIDWTNPYMFDAPAAADRLLFAAGTGTFGDEAERIAESLWRDYQAAGPRSGVVDMSIPGTRTMELPQFRAAPRRREAAAAVQAGEEVTFKTSKGSSYVHHADGTTTRTKALRPEHPGDSGLKPRSSRTVYITEDGANALSEIQTQGGPRKAIEFVKTKDGDRIGIRYKEGKDAGNFERRTVVSFETEPRVGLQPLEIWNDGSYHFGNSITEVSSRAAVGEVRDALGRIPAKAVPGPIMGMRSAIKVAAHELSIAGMELTPEVFSKIARALVNTDRAKLRAGAFNKAFWNEVLKDVPAEVAANIRTPGKRAFVGGIDKSVQDLALREDMVDAIYQAFRHGEHLQPGQPKSLIFQVLQQIKDRGGRLNRQEVANIIDELRTISQEPPTRVNARGAQRIDFNARRVMVNQIINSRVPAGGRPIAIPKNLISQMNALAAGGGAGISGTSAAVAQTLVPAPGTTIPKAPMFVPGLSRLLNRTVVAMQSENEGYRLIGLLGFNARRSFDGFVQKLTIMEASMQFLHERAARLVTGFRQNFTSHVFNNDPNVNITHAIRAQFGNAAERTAFNRRVLAQVRSGAFNDASAGVNNYAKVIQQILRDFHELASSVGLKGFDKSQIVNYFPRVWRFDRIRKLSSTKAGMDDLVAVIKKAIDQNGRKVVIDGVEETITGDIDQAAYVFAERLVSIAKNTENAPLTAQDQQLFDAITNLLGPIKANSKSKTPFGRSRVLLDEAASISATADHLGLGTQELSIADLFHDDIAYVMKKYMTSVLGAVNEKRMLDAANAWLKSKGIFSPQYVSKTGVKQKYIEATSFAELKAIFRKEFGEAEIPAKGLFARANSVEGSVDEIMAALRYEPLSDGIGGWGDRLAGYSLPLMYLSTGGQFGLAALTETSRIVGTLGLTRTVEQMPIMAEMVHNWWNLDRPAKNFASFIDQWFSPSTDRLRRALSSEMIGVGDAYDRNVVKKGLDSTANFFSDLSMLTSITSMTQQLTAATTLQHLFDVARMGTRRLDDVTVRTLGLTPQEYEALITFVGKNAETKAGFFGERIVGLKNMGDPAVDNLKTLIDRMVRTRIQDVPTRGDFHKGAFAWYARFLTQFKTFNIKGIDNFLLQNASRVQNGGGGRVAAELGAALTLASVVQYLRSYSDYETAKAAGDFERMDKAEKRLGLDGFVRGALTGPSELWLPSLLIETGNWTVNKEAVFSDYRYSGLPSITSPAVMGAYRGFGVMRDVLGSTVGKGLDLKTKRDFTRSTLHNLRMFLPFQNLIFLKQYLDVKEEQIADEYNLYETQIRYQD